jgi:hypothetical protein
MNFALAVAAPAMMTPCANLSSNLTSSDFEHCNQCHSPIGSILPRNRIDWLAAPSGFVVRSLYLKTNFSGYVASAKYYHLRSFLPTR